VRCVGNRLDRPILYLGSFESDQEPSTAFALLVDLASGRVRMGRCIVEQFYYPVLKNLAPVIALRKGRNTLN
jgi:hypothetical protein